MKVLKHPLNLILYAVGLAVYSAQHFALTAPPWIYFYLNDLLCMPIVLSFCLAGVRLVKRNTQLFLPTSVIISLTLYYALFFEVILPRYNTRYTSDWIDVGLYILGAFCFYLYQKRAFKS